MRAAKRVFACLLLALCAQIAPGYAHTNSLAYLDLQAQGEDLRLQWSVALTDLNEVADLELDRDGDRAITWGELRANAAPIAAVFAREVQLEQAGHACIAAGTPGLRVDSHQGEPYAVLDLRYRCHVGLDALQLRYGFQARRDAQHRAIVTVRSAQGEARTSVAAPDGGTLQLELGRSSAWSAFAGFVKYGFQHILEGWDHVLFVLALVLSAMRARERDGAMVAVRSRAWGLLKLITLFTLAHSLTLVLAALQWVSLPSRLIEAGIAASIVVTAANNLVPFLRPRWEAALVFGFGLLHGLGFAALLSDLLLSTTHRVTALAGFNIGVELGQLVVVALALAALAAISQLGLRRSPWLRQRVTAVASLATACAGAVWFVQRAF